jgi:hypothetical protein
MATRNVSSAAVSQNILSRCCQTCFSFFHIIFQFQGKVLKSFLFAVRGSKASSAASKPAARQQKKNGYQKMDKQGQAAKRTQAKYVKPGGSPTKAIAAKKNLNITEDLEAGGEISGQKVPSPSENDRLLEWTDSNGRQYRMDDKQKRIDVVKIFGETKKYKEISFLGQDSNGNGALSEGGGFSGDGSNSGVYNNNNNKSVNLSKLRIKKIMVSRPTDDHMPHTNAKLQNYEVINCEYLHILAKDGMKDNVLGPSGESYTQGGKPIGNGKQGANRRRRIHINLFKKKKPFFTPTKLTTIYENLAY